MNGMKLCDFHKYCAMCKHKDKSGTDDPCNECLSIPARQYSHKPQRFEEDNKHEKKM